MATRGGQRRAKAGLTLLRHNEGQTLFSAFIVSFALVRVLLTCNQCRVRFADKLAH